MKKFILPVVGLSLVLASCGGASTEDNKKGVDTVCACMKEKDAKAAENNNGSGLDLGDAMRSLDYSLCALDAVKDGADVYSEDFAKQLGENCPDLKELHKKYQEAGK